MRFLCYTNQNTTLEKYSGELVYGSAEHQEHLSHISQYLFSCKSDQLCRLANQQSVKFAIRYNNFFKQAPHKIKLQQLSKEDLHI